MCPLFLAQALWRNLILRSRFLVPPYAPLAHQFFFASAGFNSSAEPYHWCAMVFGAHWRQRIDVALARG
jgi:hypothetical protein